MLPIVLQWKAPAEGHSFVLAEGRWRRAGGKKWSGPTPLIVVPDGMRFREFNPLADNPALFRTFVAIGDAPEDALRFANAYGLLTPGDSLEFDLAGDPVGEVVSEWGRRARNLRGGVMAWDMIKAGKGTAAVAADLYSEYFPRVALTANWLLQHLPPRLVLEEDQEKPTLEFRPDDLWTALVAQFTYFVAFNGREHRQCTGCGKWFELAPWVNRADRFACSARCRARAHRAKQERARQLHAEGKTPKRIAKELGVEGTKDTGPVETVKGWIAKGKG